MENYDVIWCEICTCKPDEQEFCFFVVASGMDRAMLIAGDLKTKIEKDTGRFLIMEEDRHPECTYISRTHYGCAPYPKLGRDRVLHAGLVNLEATKIVSSAGFTRRQTEPDSRHLLNPTNERRHTVQNLLGTRAPGSSPRHSPVRSPSPARSTSPSVSPGGTSLQGIVRRGQNEPQVPGSTSDPTADYTGKTLSAFDQGRRSDGGLSDGAARLSDLKLKRPSEGNLRVGKLSLTDLKIDRVGSGGSTGSNQERFFPSKDSGIGTSADLVLEQDGPSPFHSPASSPSPYSKSRKASKQKPTGYDHLGPPRKSSQPQISYDHLSPSPGVTNGGSAGVTNRPPVPPRSGVSMGDPYLDF